MKGKPEDLQQKMVRGKLSKFLAEKSMEHQPVGFAESDLTIGEHIKEIAKKSKVEAKIIKAERFGL